VISAQKPFAVGISGPSGAGKSCLSEQLASELTSASVISLDWFFRLPSDGVYKNYWDIRCYDTNAFIECVANLSKGMTVEVPEIEFETFSAMGLRTIAPREVLLIEGMALFRAAGIFDLLDLAVFLSPPAEIVVQRKMDRDYNERKRPKLEIEEQLVWVMQEWRVDLSFLPPQVKVIQDVDPLQNVFKLIQKQLAQNN